MFFICSSNRRWTYTQTELSEKNLTEREMFERRFKDLEFMAEQKIRLMQAKFDALQQEVTSKGKGRGKKSQPLPSTSASTTRSVCDNFATIHLDTASQISSNQSQVSSERSFDVLQPASDIRGPLEAETSVHIQKLDLILNGEYNFFLFNKEIYLFKA